MSQFIIKFANNQHICENYSLEAMEFFAKKPYVLTYYRFMAIYPFINAILSSIALILYSRRRVYLRMGNSRHLRRLLMNLCVWDLSFQLVMGCNQMMIYFMETGVFYASSKALVEVYVGLLLVSIVAVTWTHISRNLSVLLIAIMRYEMVCIPCNKKTVFRPKTMKRNLSLIFFLPLAISVPRFLEFSYHICLPKLTLYYIQPLMLVEPIYFWFYSGFILCVSQSILPAVALLVLTSFLVRSICARNRTRQISFKNANLLPKLRQYHLCRPDMLITALCAVFWLCELPGCLKMVDIMHERLHELGWFMNLMPCIDSTFNFAVYVLSHYLGTFATPSHQSESSMAHISLSAKSDNLSLSKKKISECNQRGTLPFERSELTRKSIKD